MYNVAHERGVWKGVICVLILFLVKELDRPWRFTIGREGRLDMKVMGRAACVELSDGVLYSRLEHTS